MERAGDANNVRKHASELAGMGPDVIFAAGGPSMGPLLHATRTVPIVFAADPDPVGSGFVASLARPGGNATGFMQFEYSLSGKWVELLKQIAPRVARAAVLRDPSIPAGIGQFAVIQAVAPSVDVEVSPVNVREASEMEEGIATFARSSNGGLIVTASSLANLHRELIVGLAARYKLPAVYPARILHPSRRLDLLCGEYRRPVPARGRLCRPYSQGREAGRPAGASSDEDRTGDQPRDREGVGAQNAANAARPRRRGD